MKKFILFLSSFSMIEAVAQDSSIVFTTDYQRSMCEWTEELLRQIPSVRCSGETIFFRGEIQPVYLIVEEASTSREAVFLSSKFSRIRGSSPGGGDSLRSQSC